MKTLALVLAGVTLIVANILVAGTTIETSAVRVKTAEPRSQAKDPTRTRPSSEEDATRYILERPLFSPDRRDFVPTVEPSATEPATLEEAAPAQAPTLQVKLLGMRTIRLQQAVLLQVADEDARWYGIGELVEGWTIQNVSRAGVTLASGASQQFVQFAEATENGQ